jgi:hypothetical protein
MICVFLVRANRVMSCLVGWLVVDVSQREIKVLLGFCVTQLYAYQTWTEGVVFTIITSWFYHI